MVFVLAGDSAMFERVIHADILGNLGRPLRNVTATRTELRKIYGEGRIESLVRDVYDKLVPPSHRFRIRVLPVGERLGLGGAWTRRGGDLMPRPKALLTCALRGIVRSGDY